MKRIELKNIALFSICIGLIMMVINIFDSLNLSTNVTIGAVVGTIVVILED